MTCRTQVILYLNVSRYRQTIRNGILGKYHLHFLRSITQDEGIIQRDIADAS